MRFAADIASEATSDARVGRHAAVMSPPRRRRQSAGPTKKAARRDPRGHGDQQASSPPEASCAPVSLAQPCFASKNCSSSVDPFSAAVDDSASIVVVTASK